MKTIIEANLYKAADALLDAEYLMQEKRRQRDDLIRKAAPGMTLQAIGDTVGLTRAAVGLIISTVPSSTVCTSPTGTWYMKSSMASYSAATSGPCSGAAVLSWVVLFMVGGAAPASVAIRAGGG